MNECNALWKFFAHGNQIVPRSWVKKCSETRILVAQRVVHLDLRTDSELPAALAGRFE